MVNIFTRQKYSQSLEHEVLTMWPDTGVAKLVRVLWMKIITVLWFCLSIYIVHTFMARGRVSKSCLKAEPCFYRYVHFACVPIYVFSFHHKQCASN